MLLVKLHKFGRPLLAVGAYHQEVVKAGSAVGCQFSLSRFGCRDIFHLLAIIAGRDLVDQLELNMAKDAVLIRALQIVRVGKTPKDLGREILIAAVVKWFELGAISQGKAAEILGLSRSAFLDVLANFRVSAWQYTKEDLEKELSFR